MTDSPNPTPEERAREIVRSHVYEHFEPGHQHPDEMEPKLYAAIESAIRAAEDAVLERAETFCRENASATKIVQPLTNAAYDEGCRDCADGIAAIRREAGDAE